MRKFTSTAGTFAYKLLSKNLLLYIGYVCVPTTMFVFFSSSMENVLFKDKFSLKNCVRCPYVSYLLMIAVPSTKIYPGYSVAALRIQM